MVEKLYELKNKLIEQAEKDMREKGAERIDPELYDAIKDMAEAEEKCWKAEYYRAVTEQMEGRSGYMPYGYENMPQNPPQGRYGWQNQYGSGYRRGYDRMMGHGDSVEGIRNIMNMASPEKKERIKNELRSMM